MLRVSIFSSLVVSFFTLFFYPKKIMSNSRPQEQQRTLPSLFKSLISHVNRSANRISRPESFTGIILFNADRGTDQKTYRISLKRSTALTTEQLEQVIAILNTNQPPQEPKPKKEVKNNESAEQKKDEPTPETIEFTPQKPSEEVQQKSGEETQ